MLTDDSRKRDFPGFTGKVYLNTAAESIPPFTVLEALQSYWKDKSTGMKGRDSHFSELEKCRALAAKFLEKSPDEVSFCSCSSEAYNLLNSALQLSGDDEVVISDLDFPSGATPWICSPLNPKVHLWKSRNGVLEIEGLLPLLSSKTKLVQVSLVSFLTGYRIAWEPFRDAVRSAAPNAVLSVDITQCFGRIELDCLDADCLISSTYKWLLGIHGGCVVAVPKRIQERITPHTGGWFHIENAFDKDRFERVVSNPGAKGFSNGMPNFAAVYALRASLKYLQSVGVSRISAHADGLVLQLHEALANLGIATMSPPQPGNSAGIVSFQHRWDTEINESLLRQNIHIMHQAGRLRVSIHGYNQTSDIEALVEVLNKWT